MASLLTAGPGALVLASLGAGAATAPPAPLLLIRLQGVCVGCSRAVAAGGGHPEGAGKEPHLGKQGFEGLGIRVLEGARAQLHMKGGGGPTDRLKD